MSKKILVINGHPDSESFNNAIAMNYLHTARTSGHEVRYIAIRELDFNPNLKFGYRQRTTLEPDLLQALDDIFWSDHQVWIHPLWWLGMPALMKGFFDRAFLPGLTFEPNNTETPNGLLRGKTARIITTAGDLSMDAYEQLYRSSGFIQLAKGILEYCGVDISQHNYIGPLNDFSEADRKNSLEEIKIYARIDTGMELT